MAFRAFRMLMTKLAGAYSKELNMPETVTCGLFICGSQFLYLGLAGKICVYATERPLEEIAENPLAVLGVATGQIATLFLAMKLSTDTIDIMNSLTESQALKYLGLVGMGFAPYPFINMMF